MGHTLQTLGLWLRNLLRILMEKLFRSLSLRCSSSDTHCTTHRERSACLCFLRWQIKQSIILQELCKSSHIVQFFGYCVTKDGLILAMEYMAGQVFSGKWFIPQFLHFFPLFMEAPKVFFQKLPMLHARNCLSGTLRLVWPCLSNGLDLLVQTLKLKCCKSAVRKVQPCTIHAARDFRTHCQIWHQVQILQGALSMTGFTGHESISGTISKYFQDSSTLILEGWAFEIWVLSQQVSPDHQHAFCSPYAALQSYFAFVLLIGHWTLSLDRHAFDTYALVLAKITGELIQSSIKIDPRSWLKMWLQWDVRNTEHCCWSLLPARSYSSHRPHGS